MVHYEDESIIRAPRAIIWKLLGDHLDDAKVLVIHPLIESQFTVRRDKNEAVLDRVINVRRTTKKSRWKLTFNPPDSARWEVLESEGPWTTGSYLETQYSDAYEGTRVRARGELTIMDLPFLLSQKRWVARILNDLDIEDWAYIQRYRF